MRLQDYLKKARQEGWAMGHFNISNLETLKAIVQAAKNLKSPVIIGTSEGESKFIGLKQVVALIESFRKEFGLPIFLNLDHGKTLDYIKETIAAGYDIVHFDGAGLPFGKNVEMTQRAVQLASRKKVLVEGEVGVIGGELTKPEEAKQFVEKTKVDNLAINIGTFHGQGVKTVNLQRLKEIKEKVGDKAFLVLHGGSGVADQDIKKAIRQGINIVHISTELRLAFSNTLRRALQEDTVEIAPYKYMQRPIAAVQQVVERKIKLLGSDNKVDEGLPPSSATSVFIK